MTTISRSDAPSPFLAAAALRARLAAGEDIAVIHVAGEPGPAPAEPIPGSLETSLPTHYAAPGEPRLGRLPLPAPEAVHGWLAQAGVRAGQPIVVYDAASGTAAARAWWTLSWAGVSSVHILDGGLRAWAAGDTAAAGEDPAPGEGAGSAGTPEVNSAQASSAAPSWAAEPSSSEEPSSPTASPSAAHAAPPAVPPAFTALDTEAIAAQPSAYRLIDARGAAAYAGDGAQPSHLPGAVNSPATTWQDADGRLLPRAVRRQLAQALGLFDQDAPPAVAYCGSGVAAAYWIAAVQDLGVSAALYAGSWSAWSSDPARLEIRAGQGV